MIQETSSEDSMIDRECAPPIQGNILGDVLPNNDLNGNVDLAINNGEEKEKDDYSTEVNQTNIKSSAKNKKDANKTVQKIENLFNQLENPKKTTRIKRRRKNILNISEKEKKLASEKLFTFFGLKKKALRK